MQTRAWTWQQLVQRLGWILLAPLFVLWLSACSPSAPPPSPPVADLGPQLERVSEPAELAKLNDHLEYCSPDVTILSPEPDQVLTEKTVTVKFAVTGYPIFKDPDLGLGPHLHVILDNRPYVAHYDADAALTFEDLEPGSHTLRVFASRPWHESFKNSTAYDQVTFHVLAKTPEYVPEPEMPLLTYSRPKGTYGAEPILLDFWLANAPIRESLLDNLPKDWRIRYTLNGQTAYLDQWEPIYIQGLRTGSNVVVVELVDGDDKPIRNVFNSAAREIIYTPGGQDTLSRLVRGDLNAEQALSIIGVKPEPSPTPAPPEAPITPEVPPEASTPPSPKLQVPDSDQSGIPASPESKPSSTPLPSASPPPPADQPSPEAVPPTPEPTRTPKPARTPKPVRTPKPRSQPSPQSPPQPIPQELAPGSASPPEADVPAEEAPAPIPASTPTPSPTPEATLEAEAPPAPPASEATPAPAISEPERSPEISEPEKGSPEESIPLPEEIPAPESPDVSESESPATLEPTPEVSASDLPPAPEPTPPEVAESEPTPTPESTADGSEGEPTPTPEVSPTPVSAAPSPDPPSSPDLENAQAPQPSSAAPEASEAEGSEPASEPIQTPETELEPSASEPEPEAGSELEQTAPTEEISTSAQPAAHHTLTFNWGVGLFPPNLRDFHHAS